MLILLSCAMLENLNCIPGLALSEVNRINIIVPWGVRLQLLRNKRKIQIAPLENVRGRIWESVNTEFKQGFVRTAISLSAYECPLRELRLYHIAASENEKQRFYTFSCSIC